MLSVICEEFHCRPSEAYDELMNTPLGLIFEVIEAGRYANAKALTDAWDAYDSSKPQGAPAAQRQTGPMFTRVAEIEAQIFEEEQARE